MLWFMAHGSWLMAHGNPAGARFRRGGASKGFSKNSKDYPSIIFQGSPKDYPGIFRRFQGIFQILSKNSNSHPFIIISIRGIVRNPAKIGFEIAGGLGPILAILQKTEKARSSVHIYLSTFHQ